MCPMPANLHFRYETTVHRTDAGLRQHYLPVPQEYADAFDAQKIRRLILRIADLEWRRALMRNKDGERFILVGQSILRKAGLRFGMRVKVFLTPDADPDAIELGEEFEEVLNQDPEAARRFYGFTPGMQRSLAYYVTSAKRVDTRIKRALELAVKIRTNSLYSDRHPRSE